MKQSEIQKYFSILLLMENFSFSNLGQHLTTVNIVKIGINLERMLGLTQWEGWEILEWL